MSKKFIAILEELEESFGPSLYMEFKNKFSNFNPTFKQDGKTISFETGELDKDGLLIHITTFLNKVGKKFKTDIGDYAAYKMPDDNVVVVKTPVKTGRRYIIELKFAYA